MPSQEKEQTAVKSGAPLWAEVLGWYGTLAIVGAYLAVSFGWLHAEGLAYQLVNITGAMGLMAIAWVKRVKQNVVLNLFWAGIGIAALVQLAT